MSARRWSLSYNAPFSLTFSLACLAAFLLGAVSNGYLTRALFSISSTSPFYHPLTWVQLVTHVLGHASVGHLVSNLALILLLGPLLEERYGVRKLLLVSLVTAVTTGLIMVFILPGTLLGASGVAFALITLASFSNSRSGAIPLTFVLVAVLYLGREVAAAWAEDSIAQFAHLVGGGVGALFGYLSRR